MLCPTRGSEIVDTNFQLVALGMKGMRKPIYYNFADGLLLYAVLYEHNGIQVLVEHSNGTQYACWSIPAVNRPLGEHEFIARTWGDQHRLMASAMMGTGWFERAGLEIAAPADEFNEIWRLSPLGREWLVTVGGFLIENSGVCESG